MNFKCNLSSALLFELRFIKISNVVADFFISVEERKSKAYQLLAQIEKVAGDGGNSLLGNA